MLNAHQIATMNDAQMDEFLKTLLVRYLKKKHGMTSLELLNDLLNFALDEGIIENQDNDHQNLVLNCVYPALTKTST